MNKEEQYYGIRFNDDMNPDEFKNVFEFYKDYGRDDILEIISKIDKEKRELFDEAAGIVKYKKRKAVAERDLAEEQLNFSRITDILSEIEKQVGPLQKQSEIAKEYLKLKETLKKLEINLFLLEYEKNEKNKIEIDTKLTLVTEELEKTKTIYENTQKIILHPLQSLP